jgi:hypothetical protein
MGGAARTIDANVFIRSKAKAEAVRGLICSRRSG